jgi:uridine phosphorylase
VPVRLQPKTPLAADSILVGDPGRALLLAQELLEQPKMSNHARGLWGYTGRTAEGAELTIQATGMGAPSAAAVLVDLAELGVRRAIRIGTCAGLDRETTLGELLVVSEAVAAGGSASAFDVSTGAIVEPDPVLTERLNEELGDEARPARVVSLDAMPAGAEGALGAAPGAAGAVAADLQTAVLLARARSLGIAAAAVLIVAEREDAERLEGERLERAARRAGSAAAAALSP